MYKKNMIYHYTNMNAFINIIKTETLWATKIDCMNDETEGKIAFKKFYEEIDKRTIDKNIIETLKQDIGKEIEKFSQYTTYIVSFSECENSLNQWTRYAKDSGFSIGFSRYKLDKYIKENNESETKDIELKLTKCIYDGEMQTKLISEIIDTIEKENTNISQDDLFFYSLAKVLDYVPLFKDKAYSDENEVRLIIKVRNGIQSDCIDFREGFSSITSFYRFKLKGFSYYINSIWLGPCADKKRLLTTTKFFLSKYMKPEFKNIYESNLPFRR